MRNKILKISFVLLFGVAFYSFIIIGLGTDGIGDCKPGAAILYLFWCAGYGWFFGSWVSRLIKKGNADDNSRN